jgi:glycine oxidase
MAAGNATADTSDVIVAGAGLIGCAIALRLAQNKIRVSVFERGDPGCEASGAGAGMIAPQGETVNPDEFYDLCAASRDLYPAFVAEVQAISGQKVNLVQQGSLMVATDECSQAELERIREGQTRIGLRLERLTANDVRQLSPRLSPGVLEGIFVPGDNWLDNEALVSALHSACRNLGVEFHLHTAVGRFIARNGRVESVETWTEGRPAPSYHSAGTFVLAAGAWSGEAAASLHVQLPVTPCRGQIIEFDGADGFPVTVRAGHHYLVPRSAGRLIAGSTMEYVGYEKQVTGEGLITILEGVARFAPFVKYLRFRRAWAGLRPDTKDHKPVLGYGKLPNLVFATGHFRNGILLTPMTAKLISELLLIGSTSFPIDAYSPARFGC